MTGKLFVPLFIAVFYSRGAVTGQAVNLTGMLSANHCSIIEKSLEDSLIARIVLRFYYGNQSTDYLAVPLNRSTELIAHEKFDNSSCTVGYIFGWNTDPDGGETQMLIQDYRDYGGYNVILVDWRSLTEQQLYEVAVSALVNSCKAIAHALDALVDAGATLCHLSGHSLGGHGVGHVSRNMRNRVRFLIALDPAGPLFYPPLRCVEPIAERDAECVEIIHTDSGVFGAPVKTGRMDHWPNDGSRSQPGCGLPQSLDSLGCSHSRSRSLWTQALVTPTIFVSRQCSSWLAFQAGLCNDNPTRYIGQCDNNSVAGDYYLRTSGDVPFGLGLQGASPVAA